MTRLIRHVVEHEYQPKLCEACGTIARVAAEHWRPENPGQIQRYVLWRRRVRAARAWQRAARADAAEHDAAVRRIIENGRGRHDGS